MTKRPDRPINLHEVSRDARIRGLILLLTLPVTLSGVVLGGALRYTSRGQSIVQYICNAWLWSPMHTTVEIKANADFSALGESFILTAIVAGDQRSGTPTGFITFKDNADDLRKGIVLGQRQHLVHGVATLEIAGLSIGPHRITAEYDPDAGQVFDRSTSLPRHHLVKLTQTVAPGNSSQKLLEPAGRSKTQVSHSAEEEPREIGDAKHLEPPRAANARLEPKAKPSPRDGESTKTRQEFFQSSVGDYERAENRKRSNDEHTDPKSRR
jgi:hypothetical protein